MLSNWGFKPEILQEGILEKNGSRNMNVMRYKMGYHGNILPTQPGINQPISPLRQRTRLILGAEMAPSKKNRKLHTLWIGWIVQDSQKSIEDVFETILLYCINCAAFFELNAPKTQKNQGWISCFGGCLDEIACKGGMNNGGSSHTSP